VNAASPSPRAATARTLLWTAAILIAVGAALGSPAGGILVHAVAVPLAIPALFFRGRTRWIGAAVLVATLALAAARLPEARTEMDRYRARAGEQGARSEASR
jgi:hypothetical protein